MLRITVSLAHSSTPSSYGLKAICMLLAERWMSLSGLAEDAFDLAHGDPLDAGKSCDRHAGFGLEANRKTYP